MDDLSSQQIDWNQAAPATLQQASPEISYPTPTVIVTPLGHAGYVRIASVRLFPTVRARVDNINYVAVVTSGRTILRWPVPMITQDADRDPRPFYDELLEAVVPNYPPPFKLDPSIVEDNTHHRLSWMDHGVLRYQLPKDGVVVIAWRDIQSIHPDGNPLFPEDIAVGSGETSIPLLALDSNGNPVRDRELTETDRMLFWAPAPSDPYSRDRIITVHYEPGAGRTMSVLDASQAIPEIPASATAELRLESDQVFYPDGKQNEEQDRDWMWMEIDEKQSATVSLPRFAYQPAWIAFDAAFRAMNPAIERDIRYATCPVEINGVTIPAELRQNREQSDDFHLAGFIPQSIITGNTQKNSLTFSYLSFPFLSLSTGKKIYLDRVTLSGSAPATLHSFADPLWVSPGVLSLEGIDPDIHLGLDISNPWAPVVLPVSPNAVAVPARSDGADSVSHRLAIVNPTLSKPGKIVRFADREAVNGWLNPNDTIGMVLVGPRDFQKALEPWMDVLKQRGVTLVYAPQEDVMELFGDGILRPYPIKSYINYAVRHWQGGGPSWLVLVGDATWDSKGRFKNEISNVVPAFRGTEAYPMENWFGAVCGDDQIPDVMVARLPVRDADELAILVSKMVRQERSRQSPEPWRNHVLLLTDDAFEEYMDPVSQSVLPSPYRHTQFKVADEPFVDNFYLPEDVRIRLESKTSLTLTDKVIEALNRGVWLWEFFGHGAPNVLAHERAFFGGGSKFSDVKRLKTDMPPTMLWAFTCETGSFDYAQDKWNISIGEDLLVRHSGGAVSLIVATGRGYPRDHSLLCLGMHDAMFQRGLNTVGQTLLAANLLAMAQRPVFEPLNQFANLGDPLYGPVSVPTISGESTWSGESVVDYKWEIPPRLLESSIQATVWWRDGHGVERQTNPVEIDQPEVMGTLTIQSDGRGRDPGWVGIELVDGNGLLAAHGAARIPVREPLPVPPLILDGSPNLQIEWAKVTNVEPPYTGQTIFVEASISNTGVASATEVELELYDNPRTEGGKLCRNRTGKETQIVDRLDAGQSRIVQFRWDPVFNHGRRTLEVVVDPRLRIDESDEKDNTKLIPLDVMQKANLIVQADDVVLTHLSSGYRLDFTVRNIGDRLADRVQAEVKIKLKNESQSNSLILPPESGATATVRPGEAWSHANIHINRDDLDWIEITADPEGVVDEETHDDNSFRLPGDSVRRN